MKETHVNTMKFDKKNMNAPSVEMETLAQDVEEITMVLNEDTTDSSDNEDEVSQARRVSMAPDSPVNDETRQETEDLYDTDWTATHSNLVDVKKRLTANEYSSTPLPPNPTVNSLSLQWAVLGGPCRNHLHQSGYRKVHGQRLAVDDQIQD